MDEKAEVRSSRRALKAALGIFLGLVAVAVGVTIFANWWISSRVETLNDPFANIPRPTPAPVATPGPEQETPAADTRGDEVNFLVLGSDSRISAGDPSQWQAGAQRTDAIMLVQLAGDRGNATIMSIPRDSWVNIPGHGDHKINAAFSFGGPSLMIQTVEELTGVFIDHFVIADFESFATLTDELGGVEIELLNGLNADGVTLAPGTHRLNGAQALSYVRQRYGLPGGDFDRVKRQQNWMRAIMKGAVDSGAMTDPSKMLALADTVTRALAVDPTLNTGRMFDLAWGSREMRGDDIAFFTIPVHGTGWSPDGQQSIVVLNPHKAEPVYEALREGRIWDYVEENGDELAMLGSTTR